MANQTQMMIDAQAKIISRLREENVKLDQSVRKLAMPASYYMAIEKAIHGDDMLQSAWCDFIVILKLRCDPIPGLTC